MVLFLVLRFMFHVQKVHASCLFSYFYFPFFPYRKLAACVHMFVHRLRREQEAYRSSRATWAQQCATQAGSSRAHLSQRLHSMKWCVQVYVHRLRRYLGAYLLQLGHVDAIIFSAGVGENSPEIRRLALAGLQVAPVSCCRWRKLYLQCLISPFFGVAAAVLWQSYTWIEFHCLQRQGAGL